REAGSPAPTGRDRWTVAWMGILGFGAAFVLANWGIAASTATNAALLIVVEPVALMLLGPALLGERLTARAAVSAALAVAGAALRRVEAPRAAICRCVQPAAGSGLGVGLLDEPLTVFTLVGGGLILGGVLLAFGSAAR